MSAKISSDFMVDEKDMPATENAITELFEGIDAIYFLESGFKAISNELEKLSHVNMEIDELERERFKLKRQMQIVTKKITSSIVRNSFEFNKNVESYETIKKDGEEILKMIRNLRQGVNVSRQKCRASSIVFMSEMKRVSTLKLKDELEIIRTIHRSECKMRELIQEGDIFAFVEFSVEILKAMKEYMKYSSVKELHAKLLRLIEFEKSKIDLLLGNQIIVFVPEQYAYLYYAYNFIGHEEKMSAMLLEKFKSNFRDLTHIALAELLQKFNDSNIANLREMIFEELCKLVDPKHFLRALREIGLKLSMLLLNYHSILRFHMQEDKAINGIWNNGIEGVFDKDDGHQLLEIPLMVERGVIQKSLLDNLHQIFGFAAIYYNLLLSNFDLTHLKFDQFLKIIEISERFRKFGLRYFANTGAEIALTLQNQSNAFFKQYHSERVDELRMFMENETFTLCPVSMQFTIFDLSEFCFLKSSEAFENDGGQILEEICLETDSANCRRLNFLLIDSNSRVFDIFPELKQLEESPSHNLKFQNSISCDTPEEDDNKLDTLFPAKSMPNLCNSALNLLRIIGRYIKMSKILQCTSDQAIDAILQLYNYFIYTV